MVIFRVSFLCVVVVVVRVLDDVALGLGRRSAAWRVGALCLDLDHLVVVVAHFGLGLIARVLALGLASAPRACSSLGPLLGTSRQYGGCSHETMRIITSSSASLFCKGMRMRVQQKAEAGRTGQRLGSHRQAHGRTRAAWSVLLVLIRVAIVVSSTRVAPVPILGLRQRATAAANGRQGLGFAAANGSSKRQQETAATNGSSKRQQHSPAHTCRQHAATAYFAVQPGQHHTRQIKTQATTGTGAWTGTRL